MRGLYLIGAWYAPYACLMERRMRPFRFCPEYTGKIRLRGDAPDFGARPLLGLPQIMSHLHRQPHFRAGVQCLGQTQRHVGADAGTAIEKRGQRLPGNAQPTCHVGDGYILRQIFAKHFTGMCGVLHTGHRSSHAWSMIIQIVHFHGILAFKPEDKTPVSAHRYRIKPGHISTHLCRKPSIIISKRKVSLYACQLNNPRLWRADQVGRENKKREPKPPLFNCLSVKHSGDLLFLQSLDGKTDAALLVHFQHLDADDLALAQLVADVLDALARDLRDVHQAVLAGQDGDEGAEVHELGNLAFVDHADFDIRGELLDAAHGFLRGIVVGRGDLDRAVVLDVDGAAGLLGERADGRAALADHVADALRVDLDGDDARGVLGEFGARRGNHPIHLAQDMQPAFLRLLERDIHDFLVDTFDLDVHLQGGHAAGGAGYLEVHVAEMILVTDDVGEHGEALLFLDEAHRHTRDRGLDGNAGVHQRQRRAANGGHGAGAVGFGDFGHHAQYIRIGFHVRQYGHDGTLGQPPVTDLAALGAADAADFAHRVRGEVVMQHEGVFALAFQRVDDLRVAPGAERGHDQRLGLATREQRRAVRARQHAGANGDGTHGARVAPVDARLARQDFVAHATVFDVAHDLEDFFLRARGRAFGGVFADRHLADLGHAVLACGLLLDAITLGDERTEFSLQRVLERGVFLRRLPGPGLRAGILDEFVDGLDGRLHLLVAEHDGAEHDFFRQFFGLGFDHQHRFRGAGES